MDQDLLEAMRKIIVTETKKIVQQETRKIVQEETKKIVQQETRKIVQSETAKLSAQVKENTQILRSLESNKDIQNARMDRMQHDLAQLTGCCKKIEDLEDRYIHHSHRIVIDTSEAVEKDAS
ncbi:hypothetical protein HSACCH_01885 [Halanaerobium saccharolyticum subsp. saccharolyticum DSM 6643]|uniref:Uncharacterized protein n=1 Tax=Halanaerobium saccharolyticum subsp. saccharolyticum DSM 6643 TaxID=1293054 RepID=M5EFY2_9FIRM|nr:hypothetical protein [Halanaerobium saccharolyticum]CCU80139.1 hypothetical protein HSACCH_01885 [Halanaerobium saccharolyticum subsp. saccharolyticum DSM 6643]